MDVPLYLYTGPEFGERNTAVQTVKDSMKKKYGVLDEYLFYATDTPVARIMTVLQSGSLFSAASCIVLRAAEAVRKKEDVDMIVSWTKNAAESTSALILVSDEISVDAKLDKAVPPAHKKVFWEMFDDRKIPWLNDFFRRNDYTVDDDAAEDILDMVENNTEELRSECSRFFILFPKGHNITSQDVEAVLAHNREETAFSLFDTMASGEPAYRKFEQSLDVLQKMRLSKDSSSVMLIAGLTSCFRRLEVWHKLNASGQNDDFNLKINGFSSRKAKSQYSRASQIWSPGQTAAILAQLSSTDMDIRSGGTLIEDILLQRLVYEIVIKKGASCAEYENV
ncbi:MAG: DNA polymerase III subunit delta [Treponema sp.]